MTLLLVVLSVRVGQVRAQMLQSRTPSSWTVGESSRLNGDHGIFDLSTVRRIAPLRRLLSIRCAKGEARRLPHAAVMAKKQGSKVAAAALCKARYLRYDV